MTPDARSRVVVVFLAALSLAACGSGSGQSTGLRHLPARHADRLSLRLGRIHLAGPAPCQTRQLHVAIGRPLGTAGSETVKLVVSDRSGSRCRVDGYFAVQLLGVNGRLIRTRVLRDPNLDGTPRQVTIGGSSVASFIYQWGDNPSSSAPCPVAKSLLLTAPGAHDSVRIRAQTATGGSISPCGNLSTTVSAVAGG